MEVGEPVPDFALPNERGETVRLSSLLAKGPVVLFFYPAAMTTGCTAECRYFRDQAEEFAAFGAQRVGISTDPIDKQQQFSEMNAFDFPLLSDEDGTVARQFGVHRSFKPLPTKRRTFVIGRDCRLLGVIKSETRMHKHADRALEVLGGAR